jgi:tetratricopeptide (TPR) repeat protein
MDAHELTQERDRRKQDYQRVYPHTMGGTCTSSQDAPEVVDKAQMTGRSRLIGDLQELCELVSEDGIDELRRELMVMDFFPLRMPWTVRYLLDNLPIEGVEIYLQCVEARLEELRSHLEAEGEDSSDQALADVFNRQYGLSFCNKIGERYEDDGSYRKAIAWYARSLVYAKKLSPESLKKHGKLPSLSYCNLGLAQKKAGLLTEALSSYDECLRLLGDPNDLDEDGTDMLDAVSENRDSLFEEIAKWTGKSGKLTPGC